MYAVNYPASYDFLQSAPQCADDTSAHVQATVASCPDTSIVLGGYSQGAAVVDLITADPNASFGFGWPMPPAVADHVAAVAVLGSPSDKIGRPLTAISPLYGANTIELCNGLDPVRSDGDNRAAHSLYVESGLASEAAQFVSGKLVAPAPAEVLVNTSDRVG